MEKNFCEQLTGKAFLLGIQLTKEQAVQLWTYYQMLLEKNKVMNLTAITEEEEVITKHFLDSMSIVRCLAPGEWDNPAGLSLIDVGTGAGFPGMVLKIVFPALEVTLFDSLKKRLVFLDEVTEALGLKGIRTVHGRAEDFGRDKKHREQYDYVTSRAVANLSTLAEYCLPFAKVGGSLIAYKTQEYENELLQASGAIRLLGGGDAEACSFLLPESEIGRSLIRIRKKAPTPAKYPRKAGVPSKEPLV